jgi:Ankyrin repeats (many copies)
VAAAVLLVEAGSDINAQAANLDSPWLLAGALGRTEILRHMIPKGPDLSLRNRFGGNALIPACERGHVETVKLLLTTKIVTSTTLAGPVSLRLSSWVMVGHVTLTSPSWCWPPEFLIHVCLAFNFDLHARIDQCLHLDEGGDR